MKTFYDSFSGLVPARETTRWSDTFTRAQWVEVEVLSDFKAYRKGERLTAFAHDLVTLAPKRGAFIRVNTAIPKKY